MRISPGVDRYYCRSGLLFPAASHIGLPILAIPFSVIVMSYAGILYCHTALSHCTVTLHCHTVPFSPNSCVCMLILNAINFASCYYGPLKSSMPKQVAGGQLTQGI